MGELGSTASGAGGPWHPGLSSAVGSRSSPGLRSPCHWTPGLKIDLSVGCGRGRQGLSREGAPQAYPVFSQAWRQDRGPHPCFAAHSQQACPRILVLGPLLGSAPLPPHSTVHLFLPKSQGTPVCDHKLP